jgi:endonuclease YncB( thermonuclease family)
MYQYWSKVAELVDGDTIHAQVDVGFEWAALHMKIRFAGINCPELHDAHGKPNPPGVEAAAFTAANLPEWFVIQSVLDRQEAYGRYLGWIILPDGRCLNRMLIDSGHAVPLGPYPIDPPPPTPIMQAVPKR